MGKRGVLEIKTVLGKITFHVNVEAEEGSWRERRGPKGKTEEHEDIAGNWGKGFVWLLFAWYIDCSWYCNTRWIWDFLMIVSWGYGNPFGKNWDYLGLLLNWIRIGIDYVKLNI